MNYKLMQRPMFRLGGNVRQNYNTGTPFSETLKGLSTEELMNMQAASADKSLAGLEGLRDLVRLQTLGGFTANVLPNIQTRNPLRFVSEFLSNPETINLALKGLGGLRSVDAKAGEIKRQAIGEKIKGDIALKKLGIEEKRALVQTATQLKLKAAEDSQQLLQDAGGTVEGMDSATKRKYYDLRTILGDTSPSKARQLAISAVNKQNQEARDTGNKVLKGEEFEEAVNFLTQQFLKTDFSYGGRVGFQEGTPDPTLPQPKPKGPMDDRKVENLMKAAPALENPGEVKEMAMKDEDVFAALRRRLPQEITDDVVRLIAYNPEAFADFADISDQSDVDSFNEKYNVQLVLPVENVT
jgi:hypothetical protein